MAQEILQVEREFFAEHLAEWLERAEGRFAVVKGAELVGFFNTIEESLAEGARRFGLEPFLVRQIKAEQEPVSVPALTLGVLSANPSHPTPSAN
jgi:hypothetical protein